MPSEIIAGSAADTRAYSASVQAETERLRASIVDNQRIIAATRTAVSETTAAIAWLNRISR